MSTTDTIRDDLCEECGFPVYLVEADAENPLTGDVYDRHKCPCGEKTVLDFSIQEQE